MLRAAIVLFIIALILALFGFGVVASAFADIAMILFWIFVVLFVISLIWGPCQPPNDLGLHDTGNNVRHRSLPPSGRFFRVSGSLHKRKSRPHWAAFPQVC